MKWLFFGVALVAGVGWTSAAQLKPLPTTTIHPAGAYVKWQVVGIRSPRQKLCPGVGGWDARELLPKGAGASDPLMHQLKLDRYCIYTAQRIFRGRVPFPKRLPLGLSSAKPDRLAVAPAAEPLDALGEITWAPLASQFIVQAGGGPVPLKRRRSGPDVRLVFVDTQPTGEGLPQAPGHSWHGYSLAHLAFQLICPEMTPKECPVEFATRLALKYPLNVAIDPNQQPVTDSQGGDLGAVSDLAQAILDEVNYWKQSKKNEKLVINLSIGWDGELFGELNRGIETVDPAAQAVQGALQFAAQKGALVIAAAGNRRGGPQPSRWPVLPAAWDLWRPVPEIVPNEEKLVYAIGGIDGRGLPLANTRTGGQPLRVAYGDHAVAPVGGRTCRTTAMYTGTSVSAAVVSSVAAVVWHLRSSSYGPNLDAAGVMKLIDQSGDPLGIKADFFTPVGGAAPFARRVSLCTAVASACNGGLCPEMSTPLSCSSWKPSVADLRQSVENSGAQPVKKLRFRKALPSPGQPCGSGLFWKSNGWISQDPCPMDQFGGMNSQRWTAPQPGDDPCPGCTVVPTKPGSGGVATEALLSDAAAVPARNEPGTPPVYTIALTVKPEWLTTPGVQVESAVLGINCYENGDLKDRISYAIPPRALKAGINQFSFDGIGPRSSLAGCTASVDFAVNAYGMKQSIQSPVYLDPELPQ